MSINENIQSVRQRIKNAAKRSGRDPEDITLVAVTKNRPVSAVEEVIKAGIRDIGENRNQELLAKYKAVDGDVNWHFIGHLQRNKVKYIIPFVYLIQSVDSTALAEEISKRAAKIEKVQDILLEVNISGEATKYGFSPKEVVPAIEELAQLKNIYIKGLMMMAPLLDNREQLRPYFAELKEMFDDLYSRHEPNFEMRYLSMGTTGDFEVAIEEGSNMVRIGTAIFRP